MSTRFRLLAAVLGAGIVAPSALHADPPSLAGYNLTGTTFTPAYNQVTVTFLYSLAANNNWLYAMSTPSSSGPGLLLMKIWGGSGAGDPSSFTFDWTPGTEVVFGLCSSVWGDPEIPCPSGIIEGIVQGEKMWFNGPGTRNSDGKVHAASLSDFQWNGLGYGNAAPAGSTVFGFEDIKYSHSDKDYNDVVFAVSSVPEPATMALMATGLVGLGLTGVVRRRRKAPTNPVDPS